MHIYIYIYIYIYTYASMWFSWTLCYTIIIEALQGDGIVDVVALFGVPRMWAHVASRP